MAAPTTDIRVRDGDEAKRRRQNSLGKRQRTPRKEREMEGGRTEDVAWLVEYSLIANKVLGLILSTI